MTALVPAECGGMTAFIPHTPFKRACSSCGGPAMHLCDYRHGGGLPCDALVCADCASSPAPGRHHCPYHARIWKARQDLWAMAHERATR